MGNKVTDIQGSSKGRLMMADAHYLKWYEMYNALPHTHTRKLFELANHNLTQYKLRIGKGEVTPLEFQQCFEEAAIELAKDQISNQYMSVMMDD